MFNQYPYINIEDLNLDYLMARMRNLEQIVKNFVALESVTFSDPIQWSIASQYAKNVVVLDENGNAFLSKKAVPVGVGLDNEDYWLEIFNFMDYVKSYNSNLTFNIESNTNRASVAYSVDDWLLWDDVLYKVTAAIAADELFIVGTNIVHFTVEDFIKAWINYANGLIVQYKNDIDASEVAYRNQLASDIASTTASLQAQLDAAISGATIDSEVINARIGYNAFTYPTLGDAIRTQFENTHDAMLNIMSVDVNRRADEGWLRLNVPYINGHEYVVKVEGDAGGVALFPPTGTTPLFGSTIYVGNSYTFTAAADYDYIRAYAGATAVNIVVTVIDLSALFPKYITEIDQLSLDKIRLNVISASAVGYRADEGWIYLDLPCKRGHTYKCTITGDSGSIGLFPPTGVTPLVNPINIGTPATYTATSNYTNFRAYVAAGSSNITVLLVDISVLYSRLESDFYNFIRTMTVSGNNGDDVKYPFIFTSGKKYKFTCTGSSGAVAIFDGSNNLISSSLYAGNSTTWTATNDFDSFRLYYSNTLTVKVEEIDTISYKMQQEINMGINHTIRVYPGSTKYPTILSAALYSQAHPNTNLVIKVDAGDYDIIQEFEDYYGNDYFTNMTTGEYGLPVGYGEKWEFAPGANLICTYTGNNEEVLKCFSMFLFAQSGGIYDFEVVGLHAEATNIKYIFHDEMVNWSQPYLHKFVNCQLHISQDNISQFQDNWYATRCIGGGLGESGNVIIENCLLDSTVETSEKSVLDYHNSSATDAMSYIAIKDCYFGDGKTCGVTSNPGATTTKITIILVTNCSLGYAIKGRSVSPYMKIVDYNNIIRT